jgi:hypothetical protein
MNGRDALKIPKYMKKILIVATLIFTGVTVYSQDIEQKLKEKGISLTTPSSPVANYVNVVRTGNLLFLAGKGPTRPDGTQITGKLGKDLTVQQGYEAARVVAINHLAVLKAEL